MKNQIKPASYLLLIWILIAFCLSGCSPDSIKAKAITKLDNSKPVLKDTGDDTFTLTAMLLILLALLLILAGLLFLKAVY